jgi:hypothetical protein
VLLAHRLSFEAQLHCQAQAEDAQALEPPATAKAVHHSCAMRTTRAVRATAKAAATTTTRGVFLAQQAGSQLALVRRVAG